MNANQLRVAAKKVNISVKFEARPISSAHSTGSSTAIKYVIGWWAGDRYLGRSADDAFGALPDEDGGPFLAPDILR